MINRKLVKLGARCSGRLAGLALLLFLAGGCDFESPADFELPTWFVDIKFPLVHERYPLSGIVDGEVITPTPDSLGMQVVFEGDLPDTSIDPSYLQVAVNQDISSDPDPVMSPALTVEVDTTIRMVIPLASGGMVDVTGQEFSVPPAEDRQIFAAGWNALAAAFDTLILIDLNLPQVDESDLPVFISSVDAIIIGADSPTDSSLFATSIKNNGLPTALNNIRFRLLTDTRSPFDTLANHTQSELVKDSTYNKYTLLGGDSLGSALRMEFGFGLAQDTTRDTLTINAGDSVQINLAIRIRIASVDQAVVTITETDLAPDLPDVTFPSDVEIYSGTFATNTGFNINEIKVMNLRSTFPFDINFTMNFRNFLPPPGADSVKIETVLSATNPPYSRTFEIDGYTFANPAGPDSALRSLVVDISAILAAQQTSIPLDGSELGRFSIRVQVGELHFESLQANIIQEFPPTHQEISGMPQGFTGMAFTDVRIEFEMLNQIQLPVTLDINMVGINTFGDSAIVAVRGSLGSPSNAFDTVKTIIRLSREGTTTLIYDSPSDSVYSDSTTVPPGPGESTIVDLMSFNPAEMLVDAAAKIDGRGEIVVGASIGGSYRLLAPFEVRMDEMTFIPVTKTPLDEMDHATRNRIRSSLYQAELATNVINKFPVGGELAILQSNKDLFPLDTTAEMLRAFRDSMVVNEGWSPTDSLYIITDCDLLDPALGGPFIFNVMDDYSRCIDGLVYLVRSTGSGVDTVISYVDTLVRVILPDPAELYADTSTVGRPGAVAVPGELRHVSVIDTNRIFLMTDYGSHYVVPRFHLNGTNGQRVFISLSDYIEIQSSITFRISSTGMLAEAPDELVVVFPNGGETLNINDEYVIRWKTYGNVKKVNIHFGTGAGLDAARVEDWSPIITEITNVDSFVWTPVTTTGILELSQQQRDSVRIRIADVSSDVTDISGWYFQITEGLRTTLRKPADIRPGEIRRTRASRR
jgi:hypothetical protein